jgi:hypothetical protein
MEGTVVGDEAGEEIESQVMERLWTLVRDFQEEPN